MVFPMLILCNLTISLEAQLYIHSIELADEHELMDFFRSCSPRSPLISAHRGGGRIGFPENCIATFEQTLQFTPSIFEIDPRLTKDSVIVLMHDDTLERTSTGAGKVDQHASGDLKMLRLKDPEGNVTPYRIPTLEEVLVWGNGKTIFVLDDKGVPYDMVAGLLDKFNAFKYTLMTARNAEIAKQCYRIDSRFMFEAYLFDMQDFYEYENSGIPWDHIMAYVGPRAELRDTLLYRSLHEKKVKYMVSGARYLDSEYLGGSKNIYRDLFSRGIDIIETDLPIRVAAGIQSLSNPQARFYRYIGTKVIPLEEVRYRSINSTQE